MEVKANKKKSVKSPTLNGSVISGKKKVYA